MRFFPADKKLSLTICQDCKGKRRRLASVGSAKSKISWGEGTQQSTVSGFAGSGAGGVSSDEDLLDGVQRLGMQLL